MILSLLKLDVTAPGVRQALRNAQDMHRTIMKAFDAPRTKAQVLFRIMRSEKNIQIYVQSEAIPHWERIEESGFRCIREKDISLLPDSFRESQILHFSLFACPAKKVAGEGKNSRRILLRGEEAQLGWLKRQGENNGFEILEAHIDGKEESLSGEKSSGEFYIAGVPFAGVLQIIDVDAFRKAFVSGIGAEKAYGFGMLMVSKT